MCAHPGKDWLLSCKTKNTAWHKGGLHTARIHINSLSNSLFLFLRQHFKDLPQASVKKKNRHVEADLLCAQQNILMISFDCHIEP